MRKIIVLAFAFLAFVGCGEEIEFNTPALQGEKDGNLWEAVTFRANVDSGGFLRITGSDNFETITLVLNSTAIGEHDIVDTSSYATLIDINEVLWSTENTPDPSIQIYPANGVINLTEFNTEKATVSGSFYFNAFNDSGLSSINFNEGVFYNVPITGGSVVDPGGTTMACDIANATVAATLINYNAVINTDPNYSTVCGAYKTALNAQILACGDDTGAVQTIIDGLGDCTN